MPMQADFDPYHRWLGIPSKDQPPNHYRLLAIELFETDANVIALAADQRMAHLKTFQGGPTGALSQRLLNEVAAARVCLLNPERKAAYDAKLRTTLKSLPVATVLPAGQSGAQKASTRAQAEQPASIDAIDSFVEQSTGNRSRRDGRNSRNRVSRGKASGIKGPGIYSIIVLIVGIAGLAGVLWLRTNHWQIHLVEVDPSKPGPGDAARQPDQAAPGGPIPIAKPAAEKSGHGSGNGEQPSHVTASSAADREPEARAASKPALPMSAATTTPATEVSEQPATASAPSGARGPAPAEAETSDVRAAVPSVHADDQKQSVGVEDKRTDLLPVPDAETQEKANQLVREVFKDDIAHAKTASQRVSLADKLLRQAASTVDDPAGRFAMLQMAQKLATDSADLAILERAIIGLTSTFAVDGDEIRCEGFKHISEKSLPPKLNKALAEASLLAAERMETANRWEFAERYQAVALAAARKAQDAALVKRTVECGKAIALGKQQGEAAQQAVAVLVKEPEDADAHLALGKYLCFILEKWDEGLLHLAKGNDPKLAELAKRSLEDPSDGSAQAELGDAWWNAADKSTGASRVNFQKGSRLWYAKAVEKLSGLTKARVEQRLQSLTDAGPAVRARQAFKLAYVQSFNHPTLYLTPQPDKVGLVEKEPSSMLRVHLDFQGKGTVAFEASDKPGWYLVQADVSPRGGKVRFQELSNTAEFKKTATFLVVKAIATNDEQFVSFRSSLNPALYLNHWGWVFGLGQTRDDEAARNATFRIIDNAK